MKSPILLTLLASALLVSGCVPNLYTFNYRDIKATVPPNQQNIMRVPTKPPQLLQVDQINDQALLWYKRGYVPLGYSNFTRYQCVRSILLMEMRHQAEKVGAEVVLWSIAPAGNSVGVMAMPVYQPGLNLTANTTGNASVYGTYGSAYGNYAQTTTVTSPGVCTTQFIPTAWPDS